LTLDDGDGQITVAVPRRAGIVFQLQNIEGTGVWAVVEKGDMDDILQKVRLWDKERTGRLFFCDQCDYFSTSAEAVQAHCDEEHNCRLETYETLDRFGAKHLKVRTIKCHPRNTKGDELESVRKELDQVAEEARRRNW
jgi:hypothetical protein